MEFYYLYHNCNFIDFQNYLKDCQTLYVAQFKWFQVYLSLSTD